MRSDGLVRRGLPWILALGLAAWVLPLPGSVHAAPPVVTLGAAGAKIKVTSASLSEAIDALARAAGFKVTYEGARPNAMLYNAEIDTPTVAQTLFRLIDGQNLNYAVMFDLSGKKVTSLMVLGAQPKTGGAPGSPAALARPQPFTPPRGSRNDTPTVDDDPIEAEPEATPQPTPAPAPPVPPRGVPGQTAPFPPSPFAPRQIGSPFGPRPSPSPSP
jgi:hypothetical protein